MTYLELALRAKRGMATERDGICEGRVYDQCEKSEVCEKNRPPFNPASETTVEVCLQESLESSDPYSALLHGTLRVIDTPSYPAGMIPWLSRAYPALYNKLVTSIPDKIHAVWAAHGPIEEFEATLCDFVSTHREACALYSAYLVARRKREALHQEHL